jgi:hypothetical protein
VQERVLGKLPIIPFHGADCVGGVPPSLLNFRLMR